MCQCTLLSVTQLVACHFLISFLLWSVNIACLEVTQGGCGSASSLAEVLDRLTDHSFHPVYISVYHMSVYIIIIIIIFKGNKTPNPTDSRP